MLKSYIFFYWLIDLCYVCMSSQFNAQPAELHARYILRHWWSFMIVYVCDRDLKTNNTSASWKSTVLFSQSRWSWFSYDKGECKEVATINNIISLKLELEAQTMPTWYNVYLKWIRRGTHAIILSRHTHMNELWHCPIEIIICTKVIQQSSY